MGKTLIREIIHFKFLLLKKRRMKTKRKSFDITSSKSSIRLFQASGNGSLTAKLLTQWYKARKGSPVYVANSASCR